MEMWMWFVVGVGLVVSIVALGAGLWRLADDPQSHLPLEISMRADHEFAETLDRLRMSLGQSDRIKTIKLGLALLLDAVDSRKDGHRIAIIDSKDKVLKVFVLPSPDDADQAAKD